MKLLLSLILLSSELSGQIALRQQNIYERPIGTDDTTEERPIDESTATEELEAPAEKRDQNRSQLSLFFGQASVWQTYGIGLSNYVDELTVEAFQIGQGSWVLARSVSGIDIDLDLKASSFQYSRKFFRRASGLYWSPSVAWVFWTGEANPSGQSADEISDILRTRIQANGPSLQITAGYQNQIGSHWNWEVVLFGFARSFLTYENFSRPSHRSRTAVREKVGALSSWGLFNIRFSRSL